MVSPVSLSTKRLVNSAPYWSRLVAFGATFGIDSDADCVSVDASVMLTASRHPILVWFEILRSLPCLSSRTRYSAVSFGNHFMPQIRQRIYVVKAMNLCW